VAQDDGRRTIQEYVVGVAQYNAGGEIQEGGDILAPNVEELQSQAIHSNLIKRAPSWQLVNYYIIGASSFARLIEQHICLKNQRPIWRQYLAHNRKSGSLPWRMNTNLCSRIVLES
jgi:hypothetical protein